MYVQKREQWGKSKSPLVCKAASGTNSDLSCSLLHWAEVERMCSVCSEQAI